MKMIQKEQKYLFLSRLLVGFTLSIVFISFILTVKELKKIFNSLILVVKESDKIFNSFTPPYLKILQWFLL